MDANAVKNIANLTENEHGRSSKKQDKSAVVKFNTFLKTYVRPGLTLRDLYEQDVTKELFGKFTSLIFQDENIQWQTPMNYLSGIRRQVEEATKSTLFSTNKPWYKRLRANLNKQYVLQCIRDGKRLKGQAPLKTMSDLKAISRILFAKSDSQSLKDRTLLNHQWSAIGRSSDVGCLSFQNFEWMGSYLLVRMTRMKVRKQHSISVFCSALSWETDPMHSLACQLVADPFNVSDLLFSQINGAAKEEDKVAAHINSLLRKLSKLEPDTLTKGLKSQSSRRGSAVQASSNAYLNLSDVAHRGRWNLDGFATLFEYIAETSSSDQKVARVLAGWEDPLHNVHPLPAPHRSRHYGHRGAQAIVQSGITLQLRESRSIQ